MAKAVIGLAIVGGLSACLTLCGCDSGATIASGHGGDYYLPRNGPPERIVDGRLAPLQAPRPIDKTLAVSQDLGTDPTTGFPMRVTGQVRLEGAERKIRLRFELVPRGAAAPPLAAQQAYADGLAGSQDLVDAFILYFEDRNGMKAADARLIPLGSPDGMEDGSGGGPGHSPAYVVNILEPWTPPLDGDVSQVVVGWRDKIVVTDDEVRRWSQPSPSIGQPPRNPQ